MTKTKKLLIIVLVIALIWYLSQQHGSDQAKKEPTTTALTVKDVLNDWWDEEKCCKGDCLDCDATDTATCLSSSDKQALDNIDSDYGTSDKFNQAVSSLTSLSDELGDEKCRKWITAFFPSNGFAVSPGFNDSSLLHWKDGDTHDFACTLKTELDSQPLTDDDITITWEKYGWDSTWGTCEMTNTVPLTSQPRLKNGSITADWQIKLSEQYAKDGLNKQFVLAANVQICNRSYEQGGIQTFQWVIPGVAPAPIKPAGAANRIIMVRSDTGKTFDKGNTYLRRAKAGLFDGDFKKLTLATNAEDTAKNSSYYDWTQQNNSDGTIGFNNGHSPDCLLSAQGNNQTDECGKDCSAGALYLNQSGGGITINPNAPVCLPRTEFTGEMGRLKWNKCTDTGTECAKLFEGEKPSQQLNWQKEAQTQLGPNIYKFYVVGGGEEKGQKFYLWGDSSEGSSKPILLGPDVNELTGSEYSNCWYYKPVQTIDTLIEATWESATPKPVEPTDPNYDSVRNQLASDMFDFGTMTPTECEKLMNTTPSAAPTDTKDSNICYGMRILADGETQAVVNQNFPYYTDGFKDGKKYTYQVFEWKKKNIFSLKKEWVSIPFGSGGGEINICANNDLAYDRY